MRDESDRPDPDIPQDPGIPGSKTPEQQPREEELDVQRVPDAEQPDSDGEGHMAPPRSGGGVSGRDSRAR